MNPQHLKGQERRTFPRVKYRAYATLITTRENWPAHVIDLSFHGALIAILYQHDVRDGEEIQLTIEPKGEEPFFMYGHVAHQSNHLLGIECRATGLEQQKRLRQLVHRDAESDYMNRSLQRMLREHDSKPRD